MRALFEQSGWTDVNTVRRAVAGLNFLEEFQRAHPLHHDYVRDAPFSVIEALARLYRLDSSEALKRAADWWRGKLTLRDLTDATKAARSTSLAGRTGQFLEEEFRKQATTAVRKAVQRITRMKISTVQANHRDMADGPIPDYLFLAKSSRPEDQTIAAFIVGPYQNRTLYRKRRVDWILKSYGLAWRYDHVVLVVPKSQSLDEYRQWISRYREAISEPPQAEKKSPKSKSQRAAKPQVYAVSVEVPAMDSKDDAAVEALGKGT